MELKDTEREYADWADEEDLLLQQADAANAPFRTWLVPDVCDMDQCVKSWFLPQILQEMNTRLAKGDLSALLRQPVVSEQVRSKDLRLGGITYWRLNRVDFLADVDLEADLVVESGGRDVPGTFAFVLTLWFCTEEGFRFEVQGLCPAAERPERSFWKLDRFLVPILRRDEIEAGAERIWENCLPGKKPEERSARMLADAMKLQVTELCLFGQNSTQAILFFQDGVVQVQDEMRPEDDGPPAPVPVQVAAGTIVLNAAARRERGDPAILHECIHYEWHLLFYRLQKAVSSSPLAFRMKKVQSSLARRPADPLRWMEQQADLGAVALLLPLGVMRSRAWRLYQEASAFPARNGYFNHPGFRWERVIRTVSDEYDVSRTMVRRRLVMLGHPAAKGAVNFVDGRYITPFAFTEEYSGDGTDTLVISRKDMAGLYHRSRPFRELLETGSFLWADGHVCLNDPQYLRRTEKGLALTPWANAHADACCLRFGLVRLKERETVLIFGSLNSSGEYNRHYNEYLDRRMSMTAAQLAEKRDRLMQALPNDYPDALCYLMENADGGPVTVEQLAASAQVSPRTIQRYRTKMQSSYNPDAAVAVCLALHLPPWLSRVLLNKAGILVQNYGPKGHFGEILDCCFMDSVPEVQEYLKKAGYPPLKLMEE